ncbi:MAG: hypothetical protein K6A62_00100 [Bacteroidales bacterium]|nr:hypothetical protein [Bacteroidales bacterium]
MRIHLWLILICLTICCHIKAQIYEPYDYKVTIYCDGLPNNLVPDIFNKAYYSHFKQSDFKGTRVIDDAHKRTDVYLRSKKAKDGFLFVNKTISDFIEELDYDQGEIKVTYVYNNKTVITEEDVIQILRLRRRRIGEIDIQIDEPSGIITAYIVKQ